MSRASEVTTLLNRRLANYVKPKVPIMVPALVLAALGVLIAGFSDEVSTPITILALFVAACIGVALNAALESRRP